MIELTLLIMSDPIWILVALFMFGAVLYIMAVKSEGKEDA